MSNRKVVTELTKLWDAVASKGKLRTEVGVNDLKSWIAANPTLSSFQSTINDQYDRLSRFPKDIINKQISTEDVAERTKVKVGRLMTGYEEFIGISEVRSAHNRVLLTEAKFVECQEHRRSASKELSEIHNKLMEIRTEIDRTQRGDESYLDLIKEEITLTKQERIMRKHFEDLERTEREVFSDLSSALRFSHEKERAQNEKTKYWSIVGSLIGASLGVLGTTINNRMKQNHIKQILEETASQVSAIQSTVENLSQNISKSSLSSMELESIVESVRAEDKAAAIEQEKLTNNLQESLKMLHQLIVNNPSYRNQELPIIVGVNETARTSEIDLKQRAIENQWQIAGIAVCAVSYMLYRLL